MDKKDKKKLRSQQDFCVDSKNLVLRISMKKMENKNSPSNAIIGKTGANCDQIPSSPNDNNNNDSAAVTVTKTVKKDSSFATSVKNLFNKSSSSNGDKNNNPAPVPSATTALNNQGYTKVDTATQIQLAAANLNKMSLNQNDADRLKSLSGNLNNLGISDEIKMRLLPDEFQQENCPFNQSVDSMGSFMSQQNWEKSQSNQKQLGQANIVHTNDGEVKYHSKDYYVHFLVPDLEKITSCCYYWGKMDRYEAEKLLEGKPEGTFLLRDSAQDDYLFSVSFRKYGRSLHARIEQENHKFSFDSHDPTVFTATTVTKLVEHYKDPSSVMFFEPMLTSPLNRNYVFGLQQLCRAVIVSRTNYDGIESLCLPAQLKSFLREYHYKKRIRVKQDAPANVAQSS